MSTYILDIPGYEQQSIWGYDEQTDCLFAQLWKNASTQDAPEHWINEHETAMSFLTRIATATREEYSPFTVLLMLATDEVDGRAQLLLSTVIAQSAQPDFLAEAAQSSTEWVQYEATENPYYVAAARTDEPRRRGFFSWIRTRSARS